MHYKKTKLSALLLLGLGLAGLHAQEAIPASGGNASGSGGTLSYSIGQVAYSANSSSSGSVTQGLQQPYEISVIDGIEKNKDIALQCMVYPNPTADNLKLKVENYKTEELVYQLYNASGKLLENKKNDGNETNINMKSFAPAVYFLKVLQNGKEIKTFKIIKK